MRENVQVASPHSASLKPKCVPLTLQDEDSHFGLGIETSDPIETDPKPFLSLQLNSEYRSTYQWHDFKPPLQTIGVAGKPGGTDAGIVVIKRPPQPLFGKKTFIELVL